MSRSRRSTTSRTRKKSAATPETISRSRLAGIVDAAYQAGTLVAGTARWLIVGTLRAAESIAAEATELGRPSASAETTPSRKPLAHVGSRPRTVRRRRRVS